MNTKITMAIAISIMLTLLMRPAIGEYCHCKSAKGVTSFGNCPCPSGYKQRVFQSLAPINQNSNDTSKKYVGDIMSANFDNIDIRAFLGILADYAGLNIVATESVRGTVTLHTQAPWDQILDYILKTNGLTAKVIGNKLYIGLPSEM